ncbi:hypothetical protein DSM03_1179 [Leeuwenhoekiella aestuarii]|uniref:hypothetical protein n=1 Tax=Leeuwenhoekiella aestuarii TaxID=2249426 RepID=UPI000FFE5754|nr:hypothetical protein [Leeuwenhoekiella aestuarii]RXG11372.1 hypothetical protein DSM03_1179 [Leeuwenhoekiella aestuarii]
MTKKGLISIALLGIKFSVFGQWIDSGTVLNTQDAVVTSSSITTSGELIIRDSNLGQNHDKVQFYRDDSINDKAHLKLQLADELTATFEVGYNRYQDGIWVPYFSLNNGSLGIATSTPDEKLTVNGKIHSKEVRVDLSVPAPDYVLEKDYSLKPLDEVENYIIANKHLPEIPSANDFEREGISVGEMNMLLLKKIEELTLHLISQNKKVENLNQQNKDLIENLKKSRIFSNN